MEFDTIVKYFKKDDLKYFRQGSFKFGSLLGYRRGEAYRFTDTSEGYLDRTYAIEKVDIETLRIAGISIENCQDMTVSINATNDYDLHTFCCTGGPYSSDHHRVMSEKNNNDLTHCAIIKTEPFLDAILSAVQRNCYLGGPGSEVDLLWDDVKYGDRASKFNIIGNNINFEQYGIKLQNVLKSTFTKPVEYCYEHEVRMVLSRRQSVSFTELQPIFFQSAALRKSIVRFVKL